MNLEAVLRAAKASASGAQWSKLSVEGQPVILLESGRLPAGSQLDATLVVRGDFSCGAHCHFSKPVHVAGNCEIGKGSLSEAVSAGGNLTLCPSAEVRSFARSVGPLELRAHSKVAGEATSDTSVRLSTGASATCISAPEITTPYDDGEENTPRLHRAWTAKLPAPGNARRMPSSLPAGVQRSKLHPLGAETWFYDGDLHLMTPLVLRAHLVVKGYFNCQAGSLLEGDVKSGSALYVGERSIVRGHLTARGDLVLEAGTAFQGKLAGNQRIRLCNGVRGLQPDGPVTARAGSSLLIEDGVSIRGELRAERGVQSVASERMAVPDLLADAI